MSLTLAVLSSVWLGLQIQPLDVPAVNMPHRDAKATHRARLIGSACVATSLRRCASCSKLSLSEHIDNVRAGIGSKPGRKGWPVLVHWIQWPGSAVSNAAGSALMPEPMMTGRQPGISSSDARRRSLPLFVPACELPGPPTDAWSWSWSSSSSSSTSSSLSSTGSSPAPSCVSSSSSQRRGRGGGGGTARCCCFRPLPLRCDAAPDGPASGERACRLPPEGRLPNIAFSASSMSASSSRTSSSSLSRSSPRGSSSSMSAASSCFSNSSSSRAISISSSNGSTPSSPLMLMAAGVQRCSESLESHSFLSGYKRQAGRVSRHQASGLVACRQPTQAAMPQATRTSLYMKSSPKANRRS